MGLGKQIKVIFNKVYPAFRQFIWQNPVLIVILIVALALRLVGLKHGFPFIFHADEPTIVRSALGVRFSINPKHFDWPHLYIYLNYFAYMGFASVRRVLELIGAQSLISPLLPLVWDDTLIFYFITRIFTATLGGLTVIPVYLSGKKLFGKVAGLFAAMAIAVMPFHVYHSHFSLSDVPMTFMVAWAVYFSARALLESRLVNYVWAGLFVGLAASTKYNGGLSALCVAVAFFGRYLIVERSFSRTVSNFYKPVLAGILALTGFLIGTPFALLDWKTFSRTDGPKGAFWQLTNVGKSSFSEQVYKFFHGFIGKFANDWGYTLVALFVVGLIYFLWLFATKKIKSKEAVNLVFLYVPALSFLFYVSGFSKNRSHYYMMAYPLVALIVGWVISAISSHISKKALFFVLLAIFIQPFVISAYTTAKFVRTDSRVLMYEWFLDHKQSIGIGAPNIYYRGDDLEVMFLDYRGVRKKYREGMELIQPYMAFFYCTYDFEPFRDMDLIYTTDMSFRRGREICVYQDLADDFLND